MRAVVLYIPNKNTLGQLLSVDVCISPPVSMASMADNDPSLTATGEPAINNRKRKRDAANGQNIPHIPTESEMNKMFEYADTYLTKKITSYETRLVYTTAGVIWRDQIGKSWIPASRSSHTCTREQCTFDHLRIFFALRRVTGSPTRVHHICVRTGGDLGATLYCGGDVTHTAYVSASRDSLLTLGNVSDGYVCHATSNLHICHPRICTAIVKGLERKQGDATYDTCSITGITHGDVVMVHKFWKPSSVSASSEGGNLTRREILNGRMAGSHLRASCTYSFGFTWTDFMNKIHDQSIGCIDTPTKAADALSINRPVKAVSLNDSLNEYMAWAYMRVSSLFSSARFDFDMKRAKQIQNDTERKISKHIRSAPCNTFMTLERVRVLHLDLLKQRELPMTLALQGNNRHKFIMMYAARCVAFWGTICMNTCNESVTAEHRASQLVFQDFVIAAMYMFSEGVYLPSDVTQSTTGEWVIRKDQVLQWTLPKKSDVRNYACDNNALTTQTRAISEIIVEAVGTFMIDPRRLTPESTKLTDITIDILPTLHCKRDRLRAT